MASVRNSVNIIRNRCGRHTLLTHDFVTQVYNSAHEQWIERHEWSRKKQEVIVTTRADKTAGTVALTNGSGTVTGTSTAFASTDVGSYFQVGDDLWVVDTFASSTSITLGDLNGTAVTFEGTTVSGSSYTLFKRWYSLGAGIEDILSVFYKTRITEVDLERIDWMDPKRTATGDPRHFARGPRDMSGKNDLVQVELWPRPSSPVAITFGVKKGHSDIAGGQQPIVPSDLLEWAASVECCYYLFNKTKESKWLASADKFEKHVSVAFEAAKMEDGRKFGLSQSVKDTAGGSSLGGTDFGLDHDTGIL